MTDIKYHPLVDTNMDGTDKTPMFGNTDYGCISDHHNLYLEEFLPNRYRLHAKKPHSMTEYLRYSIHCPYCGAVMDSIAPHLDQHTLAIPLMKESLAKYPPRFDITASSICIGSNDISELPSDDFLKYSYWHQLPITLDALSVIKLLGNTPDPIQEEAKKMQRSKMIIVPPKFPDAFPCSIKVECLGKC